MDAIIAVHVGLPHEACGIVLAERLEELTDQFDTVRKRWRTVVRYVVRQIERPEAGMRLTDIAELVAELIPANSERISLLVNVTECGRPPVDLLTERRLKPIPIVCTTAEVARRGRGAIHVPTRELVSSLAITMAEYRLQAPREALHADALADQLREFRAKPKPKSAADPWHEEKTGELVMALLLGNWWGETRLSSLLKQPPPPRNVVDPAKWPTFDEAFKDHRRKRQAREQRI